MRFSIVLKIFSRPPLVSTCSCIHWFFLYMNFISNSSSNVGNVFIYVENFTGWPLDLEIWKSYGKNMDFFGVREKF